MHPKAIPEDAVYSEKLFFEACRDQLPEKFHVFYSVRWYHADENGKREDSECDFLIFNPDYGYLCVEVKGGKDIVVDGEKWKLILSDGSRDLTRSPYKQAEESMRYFKEYFEEELEVEYNGCYGYAVAFPLFSVDSPITVSSPLELTIDIKNMKALKARINAIFHYMKPSTGKARFLSKEQSEKFIKLIDRRITLSVAAGSLISYKEKELAAINRVQDSIIDLLIHYPHAFIVGGAGTGKTWIAIKKLKKAALEDKKAIYLCYNKALAEYVKKQLEGYPEIECYNFDSFAYSILKHKANEARFGPDQSKEYFDLIDAKQDRPRYDVIIVDEGQDFTTDWAMAVNLLKKENSSELYVFYDESQNLFKRSFGDGFCIEGKPFVLRYNIRNTASIYDWTKEKTQQGLDTISNQLTGVEPEQREFTSKSKCITFLNNIINRLIKKECVNPESIVILSDRKKEKSVLNDIEYLGEFKLNEYADCEEEQGIKFRTIQGFKGLESDVVIYINHSYKNEPQTEYVRSKLYTAYTRAKYYLYVINYLL